MNEKNKKRFTATDSEGNKHIWKFWRQEKVWLRSGRRSKVSIWMLEDSDGYVRAMEETWIDSVPCIKMILENYGMTANIS